MQTTLSAEMFDNMARGLPSRSRPASRDGTFTLRAAEPTPVVASDVPTKELITSSVEEAGKI